VFSAVAYLTLRTVHNRLRAQLRRLRTPRQAIALLVGGLYFWYFLVRPTRGEGIGASLLGSEWSLLLATLALALLVAKWWLFGADPRALAFKPAEVQFLFPAPVSRRGLVHYKLLRAQLFILVNTVIWSVLLRGGGANLSAWLRATALWVLFSTLPAPPGRRARHRERGGPRRGRATATRAAGGRVRGGGAGHRVQRRGRGAGARRGVEPGLYQLLRGHGRGAARPRAVHGAAPVPHARGAHLLAGRAPVGAAAAAGGADHARALRLGAAHRRGVRGGGRGRVGAARTRARRARRTPARHREPRRGRARARGVAAPMVAAAARGRTTGGGARVEERARGRARRVARAAARPVRGADGGGRGALLLGDRLSTLAGLVAAVWGGMLVVAGPLWVRFDLRHDLSRIDVLRALPLRGRDVVAAEIASSTLLLTSFQWVLLAAMLVATSSNREIPLGLSDRLASPPRSRSRCPRSTP
jgi:hypothetical protein